MEMEMERDNDGKRHSQRERENSFCAVVVVVSFARGVKQICRVSTIPGGRGKSVLTLAQSITDKTCSMIHMNSI